MDKGLRKKTPAIMFAFIMSFMMLFGSITPAFAQGNDGDATVAPDGVYAVSDDSGSIKLQWEAEEGAYGYLVYRACEEDGIGFTGKTVVWSPEYTDNSVTPEKTYQYKVTALLVNSGRVQESEANIPLSIKAGDTEVIALGGPTPRAMTAPRELNVHVVAHNTVDLRWDKVEGVDGYQVWRCDGDSAADWGKTNLVLITELTGEDSVHWQDLTTVADKKYMYKIASVYGSAEPMMQPVPSYGPTPNPDHIPARPFPLESQLISLKTIQLDWPVITEAEQYILYRSVGDPDHMTQLVELDGATNNTYTDNDTDYETTYYYMVRAVANKVPSLDSNITDETTLKNDQNDKLNPPVLAANVEGQDIKVTWEKKDDKATGYKLYRATDDLQVPELYKTLDGVDTLSYLDEDVIPGVTYYYVVRAFNATLESVDSNKDSAMVPVASTFKLTAELEGTNSARLNWEALKGATEYEIFYKEEGGTYSSLGTVGSDVRTYLHPGLEGGKTYIYQVKGLVGSTQVPSNEDSVVVPKQKLDAPVLKAELVNNDTAKLDWTAVDGAKTYDIYVSSDGVNFGTDPVATTNHPTVTLNHGPLTPGVTYTYYVVAKADDISSDPSNKASVTPGLGQIMDLTAKAMDSKSIKLNWSAVEGAEHYDIYRSLNATTGFQYIATKAHPTVEHLDTGLQPKTTYYYYVIARKGSIESVKSNIASDTTPSDMCMSITPYTYCCNKKFGMLVQWTPVKGATSYTVYRSTYDGGYKAAYTTRGTSFDDKCVYPNTTYWYKVVANTGEECTGSAMSLGCSFNFKVCCDHHYGREIGFTLRWKAQSGINHYTLYRSTDNVNWTQIQQVSGSTTKYVDKPVSPKTVYYYKIVGSNGQTEIACDRSCGQTFCFDVTTDGRKDGSLTLKWKQISNAKSYTVYRSDDGGRTYSELKSFDYLTTSYVDTGLRAGYRYYYRIVSDNGVIDNESDKPR